MSHNKSLTPSNLDELVRFVFSSGEVVSRERFKAAFSEFLDSAQFNSQQIRFVELIIDRVTANGTIEVGQLYEPPFTGLHYEGLDGVFPDAQVESLISRLRQINEPVAKIKPSLKTAGR